MSSCPLLQSATACILSTLSSRTPVAAAINAPAIVQSQLTHGTQAPHLPPILLTLPSPTYKWGGNATSTPLGTSFGSIATGAHTITIFYLRPNT